MYKETITKKVFALLTAFLMQNSAGTSFADDTEIGIENLSVSTISVSCLKVTWDYETDMEYTLTCVPLDEDYAYSDNIHFEFKSDGLCYSQSTLQTNTKVI